MACTHQPIQKVPQDMRPQPLEQQNTNIASTAAVWTGEEEGRAWDRAMRYTAVQDSGRLLRGPTLVSWAENTLTRVSMKWVSKKWVGQDCALRFFQMTSAIRTRVHKLYTAWLHKHTLHGARCTVDVLGTLGATSTTHRPRKMTCTQFNCSTKQRSATLR